MQATSNSSLEEAYRNEDDLLSVRRLKIACVLALICMPAGSFLDLFVYRDFLWPFFQIRIFANILIGIVLLLAFTLSGRHWIRTLGVVWALLINASFCWMIFLTEGPSSPYYAGINLIILAAAVLLPLTSRETLLICIGSLGMYVLAALSNVSVSFPLVPAQASTFFNNTYFISITAVICVTTSHFTSKARYQDFLLRHELDVRNKKLEDLDRLKSQFFANINHELRTPLTLILSPLENILRKRDAVPGPIHDALLVAQKNALRLLKLINEILDVMRLEEDGFVLSREPVNLCGFTAGIVDSVRHLGVSKNLRIRTEECDEALVVDGDPNRLEKVLLNLLSNAIKFTPAGGAITVRLYRSENQAVIEVEDSGIGIAGEELTRIFDRFHQVDGSSTRKFQGVGLGLALARQLVEKHGGSLTARSEVGQGTTLTVALPLRGETSEEALTCLPSVGEEEPFASAFQSANRVLISAATDEDIDLPEIGKGDSTILVVDDESDMLRFLATTLADDYRVLQARTGEKGISLAKSHRPDLILLDWMLPGMDGLEVCQRLRRNPSTQETKIILLTARMDEASKIAALEQGADDFMTKPFSTVEVKTRIANLLRTAQLQANLRQRNTDLEETLDKLKKTESQLVQSEKMNALGSLSAGLLHEINNPLNYTLTALQYGKEFLNEGDDDLRETMEDIDEGMRRIRDIVSDLRSFAYPDQAGQQEEFLLEGALDSALRLISHELNGLSVTRDIEKDCVVWGAKTQVVHLLMNMIVNSAKAIRGLPEPRENPVIEITGKVEEERLRICLWDNGMGIPPDVMDKVFDPFFTTRDVGEGMGLGLSICHTIVENHGGEVRINSKKGEWTEISFDLPLSIQVVKS